MLFSRSDLPGTQGALRDLTDPKHRSKRALRAGDIVLIDQADISRADAQRFIDASVAAIVNVQAFSSGKIPNYGPTMLLTQGITLLEKTPGDWENKPKNNKKARLHNGELFHNERRICVGTPLNQEKATQDFEESREVLGDHMIALSGNLAEFVRTESPLLIDGLGIPDVDVDMDDRKVLVVSPSENLSAKLKELRPFLREYNPVIIGVSTAADVLMEVGITPTLILGDPENIATDTLRSGATVVIPAAPDGHAPGLERIQDLGVAAMTFPAASSNPTDLALLLASYHGASMIVNVGEVVDLEHVFNHPQEESTPSAMLSRLSVGSRLVDSSAVTELYRVSKSSNGWLWALLGIAIALAVLVVMFGISGDEGFVDNLINSWNNIALSVQKVVRT